MNSALRSASRSSPSTTHDVFEDGTYTTVLLNVQPNVSSLAKSPSKPLLIGTPSESGEFPVLLLLHGYLLYNSFYSQLINHIASHGYIVIAPQLYTAAGPDSTEEIKAIAAIVNWLSRDLSHFLPRSVQPNIAKLAISGHSRGGKVAFAMALKKIAASPLKISALIGIDPVDGMNKGNQTPPRVLSYNQQSFDLDDIPVMVIGSGLGSLKKNPLFPPCAPKGVNHEDFYFECRSPAAYFVVKDHGHMDMLDDETKGVRGRSTYWVGKNGKSREPMRKFVGGVIVAFLNCYLKADDRDLVAVRKRNVAIPVEFEKVDCRE